MEVDLGHGHPARRGICYVGEIHASDGVTTIRRDAELLPMIEAGIRFMFL